MRPFRVTIFGAGNIGTALAATLSTSRDFDIRLVDVYDKALDPAYKMALPITLCRGLKPEDLARHNRQDDLIVGAIPDRSVHEIARLAGQLNTHYLDFSAPTELTVKALGSLPMEKAVITGCGASPGLVDNFAAKLFSQFSSVDDAIIRVGAIPRLPTNRLGYGHIWNFAGMFAEYTTPSVGLRDGELVTLPPLGDYEKFTIDDEPYEAFITSGGLNTVHNFHKNLTKLTFKTIRHPGHLDYMQFLLEDLGLKKRRDMLHSLLANGLPIAEDDMVMLFITARGLQDGQLVERSSFHRLAPKLNNDKFNALTRVATGYAATVITMLKNNQIGPKGIISHHSIDHSVIGSSSFLL